MKTAKYVVGAAGVAALGYSVYTFWTAKQEEADPTNTDQGEATPPQPGFNPEPVPVQPAPVVDVLPGQQEAVVTMPDGDYAFDGSSGNFDIDVPFEMPPQSGGFITI